MLSNLRHSTSHIMAEALKGLFPEADFAIGPATDDGFFYDVDVPNPIGEGDLLRIEEAMRAIVARNSPFVRREIQREEALSLFSQAKYKLEIIQGITEPLSVYDQGGFVDLCRGPHVNRTGECAHFKLLRVSGSQWHDGTPLQRVFGVVFPTKEELKQHLFQLEEAKKRDHRKIGQSMGLFFFHEYAPGAPFWLPKGEVLYNTLSQTMRSLLLGEGYVAVRTPMLFDQKLWETSGHWDHYKDNMFNVPKKGHQTCSLKPMNCPSHMLVFGSAKRSYRELPLRIHDQGVLHRDEAQGALGGLTRVRQFCQDDAHIFARETQIEEEVSKILGLIQRVYTSLGLGYKAKLSTRPPDKLGDDALWDRAEGALASALAAHNLPYTVNVGDGAFYGPKIDFDVVDALGRAWQCATIQLDYQLPQRFNLSYVGEDNQEHQPVVIHRAIFGSFERFIGILIEHFAGAFPLWLAPEQVRILSVSEKSLPWAVTVRDALVNAGLRVMLDDSAEKLGAKIRNAALAKPVHILVLGEKEQDNNTVSVRGALGTLPLADFISHCQQEIKKGLAS